MNKTVIKTLMVVAVLLVSATFISFLIAGTDDTANSATDQNADLSGSQDKKDTSKSNNDQVTKEFAEALRAKAAELDKREKDLLRREQEVSFLEQDLIKRTKAFEQEKQDFDTKKKNYEEQVARQEQQRTSERIIKIAGGFKNIKAGTAAEQLSALYRENRATALYVISQFDQRTFGKIFSKMADAQLAARIIEDLKAWRVAEEDNVIVGQ